MAIALVQSRQGVGVNASSVALAYSSALTSGSFLVVTAWSYNQAAMGISDSAGHTWTPVAAQVNLGTPALGMGMRSWTAPNTGTTTPTVTVTGSSGDYMGIVISEWSGVDSTTPLDGVTPVTSAASGSTSVSTGNITPNSNNAVLYGAVVADLTSDSSITVTNGTNLQTRTTWNTDLAFSTSYKAQTTATAEALTWTYTNVVRQQAQVFVLKASAATGATATPSTVATSVGVPAPTVTATRSASVAASVVAAVMSVFAPTVTTGSNATATPSTVATAVAVPSPTVSVTASATVSASTVALTVAVPQAVASTGAGLFPTAVSASNRYLVDQNGDPWLGVGDTAWSLVGQCTDAEIVQYLDDRAAKGVNFVLFSAPEPFFADNAPNNIDDVAPFTGTPFQSTLNNTYWNRVDLAVSYAESLGITCLICPFYLGYPSSSEGWNDEVVAASNAQMATYAGYLSARYGAAPNIIWLVGHDRVPSTTEKARGNAWADQMQTDTDQLITCGGLSTGTLGGSGSGVTDWASSGVSADFDTLYTYSEQVAEESYDLWANAIPFGFFEGRYEFESGTVEGDVLLREQMWAAWCAGACYVIFGNDPIWFFDAAAGEGFGNETETWQNSLDLEGSQDLEAFATIAAALGDAWADTSADTGSTFVTTQGTGTNRVAARFSTSYGLIYHPNFTSGTITVDLSEFSAAATVTITRYDPRSGATTTIGTYATSGTQALSAPSANSAGDRDWLYVVTANAAAAASTVAVTVAVPAPTVSTSSDAAVTATTVAASTAIPAPTVAAGSTAAATVVALSVAVPAPTIATASNATVAAATVSLTVAVPAAAVAVQSDATAAAPSVAVAVAVPAPTITAASNATVTAATVAVAIAVPAPAVSSSGNVNTAPDAVAVNVAVPDPTVAATASADAAASTVSVTLAVPAPAVTAAGNATAAPGVVAVVVDIPDAVADASGNATAAPSTVTATVAVPAPSVAVTSSASAMSSTVAVAVTIPTATVIAGEVDPGSVRYVIAAESRTYLIPADSRTPEVSMASSQPPTYWKDPDAVTDYEFDWSTWLVDGDTIESHTVTVTGATLDSSAHDDSSVVAWVSAGAAGVDASVACRVVTADGRTDERTIILAIVER